MSRYREIITLEVPEHGVTDEKFRIEGFACRECNGRGYAMEYFGRDATRKICGCCDGSGSLRVEVRLMWSSTVCRAREWKEKASGMDNETKQLND